MCVPFLKRIMYVFTIINSHSNLTSITVVHGKQNRKLKRTQISWFCMNQFYSSYYLIHSAIYYIPLNANYEINKLYTATENFHWRLNIVFFVNHELPNLILSKTQFWKCLLSWRIKSPGPVLYIELKLQDSIWVWTHILSLKLLCLNF